jgi:hypothetical protein
MIYHAKKTGQSRWEVGTWGRGGVWYPVEYHNNQRSALQALRVLKAAQEAAHQDQVDLLLWGDHPATI